ncbi:MOSC domain-containing protein [Paludisphaera mucosa]|uniref:MOSC domain-containing protein n=1 Tax=Paludisphaera mucosa TaxID=3030827 RepID=A0ABT6FC26_9BACT|nr:MOSC domain-containing protein [Paludisphaera mucosa]MDG3005090.1 MOSC domain-containing protein [Paludisphaera mucosa]
MLESPAGSASVTALFVGPTPSKPMQSVGEVVAVAEHGLEGDRKFRREGRPARKDGPDREVTLIEAEAVEAVNRDGIELDAIESRRNILTRGVALNPLVGREFRVGPVLLRGIRLCDPCDHLEKLTRPGVCKALADRGGLRAQVLEGGVIRVGDPVAAADRRPDA